MPTFKEVLSSKIFLKRFLYLLCIICILFFSFALYTYNNSRKALQEEFLSYSMIQTDRIATSVDDCILEMRLISSTLYNSSTVKAFLSQKKPELIINNIYQTLQEQLNNYRNSVFSIDSIFLYSAETGLILTTGDLSVTNITSFTDLNWMDYLSSNNDTYVLFPRKKNNRYPYLLSLLKTMDTASGKSAIIININLAKLSPLSTFIDTQTQEIYLVNDNSEILYRKNQQDSLEPLNTIPELSNFSPKNNISQAFINGTNPYIFTQYHSSSYPWNYVFITNMSNYSYRLTNYKSFFMTFLFFLFMLAIILIFFFAFQASRPLQAIIHLLENPSMEVSADTNNIESKEIIKKIMTHIQTNKFLADELENQMELLNKAKFLALQSQINPHFLFNTLNMIHVLEINSLGYEHEAPELTLTLSRLLQYALESTDLVSMETEFYYTGLFLTILNQRYKNRIKFQITMQPDCALLKIPKLIIQPLIENAVFHGLSDKSITEGYLEVTAVRDINHCILTIRDNGVGMSTEKLEQIRMMISKTEDEPKESIGLHNVALRMHLLFGDAFHISINSVLNHGTIIYLEFPEIE